MQLLKFLLSVLFSLILVFGTYALRSPRRISTSKMREKKMSRIVLGFQEKRWHMSALMSSETSQALKKRKWLLLAKEPGKTAVREGKGQRA